VAGRLFRVEPRSPRAPVLAAGCGSRTPEVVGSWTRQGDCHITGFSAVEFGSDGGLRARLRTAMVDEASARLQYRAAFARFCATVADAAIPINGTWREDGPRVDAPQRNGAFRFRTQ